MCMVLIGLLEKSPDIGWKIMDRNQETGVLTTPYMDHEMVMDRTYLAKGTDRFGIYVFLNKIVAKKFLEEISRIRGRDTLLAKVELGKNVWKGKGDPYFFSEFGKHAYHFYSTNSVKIVSLE